LLRFARNDGSTTRVATAPGACHIIGMSENESDGQIQVFTNDESMHDVMRKQVAEMLENSDLTEEEKQQILVSMSCPCCGSGGVSLSIKLRD
jgi:hypothetical protein